MPREAAARLPRISIAVPSFNQGRYIRETLESLVAQQYPSLEVIVQDGGSTDGAVEIAREFVERYPDTFQLFVERDTGHANAVNKAFRRSTGDILGYLNTDDTLYPGCLHRVAREIAPARGRYIVFGRCLFTGSGSPYVGREHPAEYRGHFEMLAVWKRGYNTIPQPSTFWHRRVYETCGDFDERHNAGLDYLQWCRFSKRFAFHKIDALWSTYRMHPISVTSNKTEQEWLDVMIGYSRSQWGPWWHPLRWRCALSYRLHDKELGEQARARARRAEEAARAGRYGVAALESLRMVARSPRLAAYWGSRVVAGHVPWLARRTPPRREGAAFTGRYSDNWIGPVYRSDVAVPADARRLVLTLEHHPTGHHRCVSPALCVNGEVVERRRHEGGQLALAVDVSRYRGRSCAVEVRTPEFFIPRFVDGSPDDRELSVLLVDQRIERE